MMSVNPETEKLVSAWWEIPGKLLEGWQTTMQESLSPPWTQGYARSIDVVESLTHTGLRMQADWCKMAIGRVRPGSGEATALGQWTDQAQGMVDCWSAASQQLTSSWFQMLKQLPRFSPIGLPTGASQAMMANAPGLNVMQDLVRNSLKVQAAWASLLMPEVAPQEPEATLREAGRDKLERKTTPRKTLETDQAA